VALGDNGKVLLKKKFTRQVRLFSSNGDAVRRRRLRGLRAQSGGWRAGFRRRGCW
jgi:hypothetical protein